MLLLSTQALTGVIVRDATAVLTAPARPSATLTVPARPSATVAA